MKLSLICIQFKVFIRYNNFVFLSIVFNLFSFFLIIVLNDFGLQVNRALIIALINIITLGPFYCDMFSSNQTELKSYLLSPWMIKHVAIAKFISLTVMILSVILISVLTSNLFFEPIPLYNIKVSVLFILSSLPVYLIFGGVVSSINLDVGKQPTKFIEQFLISTLAIITFFLVQLWLKSIFSYTLIFISISIFWFYIGLPYCVQIKLNKAF